MSENIVKAPDVIVELVKRFDEHRDAYTSPQYNETQVRREFIDPFFKALDWDIDNVRGHAEQYKDVVHEDAIKIGGAVKAPDYSFRLGGRRIFFLEAKKPSVNLKEDPAPAYQLRRYAWTAKLPVSILTDFEEFIVYDTRVKPAAADKASTARTLYIPYTEYLERWDEIASLFSKEAIQKGALDKYVESTKRKHGTAEVDDAFLAEIEEWRELLAKNIALRNPGLTQRELNFAVQTTIDRIVFLRICEDRGIEPYAQLMALLSGDQVYPRLRVLYERADERYNSGLFHFGKERNRPGTPDTLTPRLAIDDKALKAIFKRLYYPESPYEFSVLPAEILGQVYERFLGSVIRLTAGGQAKVEQKPEVRKAGGVYYTPSYIVDYIVKHTVGKLLEDKTPQDVAGLTQTWKPSKTARPLAILDPACGSGSFLLGAYQYLLDWHLEYYAMDIRKWSTGKEPRIYQDRRGAWRLATSERKRILLANIHGVDIDPQAVEVTKLSLLLRVLEGESAETLGKQFNLFHERALPDLDGNIKCGNSLIGPDFYQGRQTDFDQEENYRINAFDWNTEFPDIMKNGGFDAVIGNPPYIRIQTMKEWAPIEVEFYKQAYRAAAAGNYDIYVVFIEKGLSLLNQSGCLGFICPHKFFNAKYGEGVRRVIAEGNHLEHVVHFGDQQVFAGATTYTCLLFLTASPSKFAEYTRVKTLDDWLHGNDIPVSKLPASAITPGEWGFLVGQSRNLYSRLAEGSTTLGQIAKLFVGLQTDADQVFIVEAVREEEDKVLCRSKATGREHWFENAHLKHLLKGSLNIRRYHLSDVSKRLIFPYSNGSELIDAEAYKKQFPLTWEYLLENSASLKLRNKGRMGSAWYGYVYKKNHSRFSTPKLLVPSLAMGSCFAADLSGEYYFVGSGGGGGGGYGIILLPETPLSPLFVLGLLNSSLISLYIKSNSTPFRGGYFALNKQYIEQVPIRILDLSETMARARHDKMVSLVQRMLDLHKRLQMAKTDHERNVLERQIAATDNEIDTLVYELYDLTKEEIAIVEESVNK